MKYHLITYGCQMNTADSEEMAQPLKDRGLWATSDIDRADIVLMNTCTVRDQAEHRAKSNLGRLREWKEADPHRILIVAGCAASRWGEDIRKRFPFIDLVSPATRIEQFPETIDRILKERWNWNNESELVSQSASEQGTPGSPSHSLTETFFGDDKIGYVTIMRGCNYSCSYCIVPQVRGREMYRAMDQILNDVRAKVAEGYEEVMLLGQTVNSYYSRERVSELAGEPGSRPLDFSDLLCAVSKIPGVKRIRFMSPHPRHMRERVIRAMAESPNVCRHIHLPVQSGSDAVLSRMNRLYTRAEYLAIVDALRTVMPEIKITTDIIVGFPGETEADLQDTLALIRDVRFDGLFAFKYSPRPGTASAEERDDVSPEEKEHRLQRVLALNRQREVSNA